MPMQTQPWSIAAKFSAVGLRISLLLVSPVTHLLPTNPPWHPWKYTLGKIIALESDFGSKLIIKLNGGWFIIFLGHVMPVFPIYPAANQFSPAQSQLCWAWPSSAAVFFFDFLQLETTSCSDDVAGSVSWYHDTTLQLTIIWCISVFYSSGNNDTIIVNLCFSYAP